MAVIDSHRFRRFLSRTRRSLSPTLLCLNIAAILGFVLRDRNFVLALLFHLPLMPLGLAAMLLEFVSRGHSLEKFPFSLACVGLVAVAISCFSMTGRGPAPDWSNPGTGSEVRLLHWNVFWGGRPRTMSTWNGFEEIILEHRPDILVLSEPPDAARWDSLNQSLGIGWAAVGVEHDSRSRYRYRLAVLSRWPLRQGPEVLMLLR